MASTPHRPNTAHAPDCQDADCPGVGVCCTADPPRALQVDHALPTRHGHKPRAQKPERLVDVHVTMTRREVYGDSYRDEAQGPAAANTRHRIEVQVTHRGDKRDARQALGRLLHATRGTRSGYLADVQEDQELRGKDVVPTGRAWQASAQWTPLEDDDVAPTLQQVLAWAQEIRDGRHDPPTVTVDQARSFSILGIALRKDGLFGYKRRCPNVTGCSNPGGSGNCYGNLTPAEAIEGAQKPDGNTCSAECWLDAGAEWGIEPTAQELLQTLNGDASHRKAREAFFACGAITVNGGEVSLVDEWWTKAKEHEEARELALEAAGNAMEGYDGDGGEDEGAIECEV